MTTWMRMLLSGGMAPNGRRILSADPVRTLWTPHALPPLPHDGGPDGQERPRRVSPSPRSRPQPLGGYAGLCHDAWPGGLRRLAITRADGLTGTPRCLPHDLFVRRQDNRAMDGADDCFVLFRRDTTGRVMDMRLQGHRP